MIVWMDEEDAKEWGLLDCCVNNRRGSVGCDGGGGCWYSWKAWRMEEEKRGEEKREPPDRLDEKRILKKKEMYINK